MHVTLLQLPGNKYMKYLHKYVTLLGQFVLLETLLIILAGDFILNSKCLPRRLGQ